MEAPVDMMDILEERRDREYEDWVEAEKLKLRKRGVNDGSES